MLNIQLEKQDFKLNQIAFNIQKKWQKLDKIELQLKKLRIFEKKCNLKFV